MSSSPDSNTERPAGSSRDQAEAENHKRAECEARIKRLLSALEGGPSLDTSETSVLPAVGVGEPKSDSISEPSRFLLVDLSGPIAEFGSWEEANKFKKDRQHYGAGIISVAKQPLEPRDVRDLSCHQQPEPAGGPTPPKSSPVQVLTKTDAPVEPSPNRVSKGDAPPANPKVMRVAGRIFASVAKTTTRNASPPILVHPCELLVLGASAAQTKSSGNSTLTHAPRSAHHQSIHIHYTTDPTNSPT